LFLGLRLEFAASPRSGASIFAAKRHCDKEIGEISRFHGKNREWASIEPEQRRRQTGLAAVQPVLDQAAGDRIETGHAERVVVDMRQQPLAFAPAGILEFAVIDGDLGG
jgi:hypothetical protein